MSRQELHDYLTQLKEERKKLDLVDSEYQLRLDEIIESLEQQRLYPDTFDQYSTLGDQVRNLLIDYEADHPAVKAVLDGIHEIIRNFKS